MLNVRFAKDYFFYLIKAKTRHGTHSPFIYRLVDEVIYDHHAKKVYAEVEKQGKRAGRRDIKLGRLTYRLLAHFEPGNIIMIGNSPALISSYIKHAVPHTLVHLSSDQPAYVFDKTDKVDVVYFAGDVDSDAMLNYFELCLPKVHENSMLVFADIYESRGTKDAWTKIKAHPRVTATVDMFWLGLVFFRSGQAKEDFMIRI